LTRSPSNSPSVSSHSPHFYQNRFQYPGSSSGDSPYSPNNAGNNAGRNMNFRKSFNQTPNSAEPGNTSSSPRFNNPNYSNYKNTGGGGGQQNGVSLFIKANNVSEELLRSLFSANVSEAKILSIDVKTQFVDDLFFLK
jgi:hypothetical protein